jgi:hypothetical protein
MSFASALIFVVGLAGYAAVLMGIAHWSVPAAMIIGGMVAMWWCWYVSVGAQLQMSKLAKGQGAN